MMNAHPNPSNDPRTEPGFAPECFPACNGQALPQMVDLSDRNGRILLEFAIAYYELNREYRALVAVRNLLAADTRFVQEQTQLRRIEASLRRRDELEDFYAPFGVIVEPQMKDGMAVNLVCSFGNQFASGRQRSEWVTLTAAAPVPLPADISLERFVVEVEGPEEIVPPSFSRESR